jgi:integrase
VGEKQTVAQFLNSWLEGVARPTVRATTFEGYERIVRLHLNPAVGSVRLARLTPQALADLYHCLLDKGLSAKTVRLVHAMLHRALGQAVRWGSVAVNVADAVDAPRPQRREFRTLTAEEAGRLLNAARENRFHALYVVALTCGLREGELLGLRWADIDLDKAVLGVRQQAIRVKGQWLFSEPKTAKGRRTVTLPSLAVEALR